MRLQTKVAASALGVASIVLAFTTLISPRAEAAVYWGNHGFIGAVNLDGSGADTGYFDPTAFAAPNSFGANCDVAVNGQYLYWLGSAGIGRVNLDGPTVSAVVVPALTGACGLAASESHLYWTNAEAKTIGRARSDGTEANAAFISNVVRPCGIAVDDHHIYWAGQQGIGRANLEGGEVEPTFIPGFIACGVAVTGRYIFWGGYSGSIGRANVDGSEANDHFVSGTGTVASVAADASHLYWTNWTSGNQTLSTIGRSTVEGTEVDQSWVTTNITIGLDGIAADSRPSLSPLPLPSQPIQLGKVRHNRRTGVVVLSVQAWEGGELGVMSPEIKWRVLEPHTRSPMGAPVRWRLKLWPGKLGDLAHHIQALLEKKRRAPITLRLYYSEPGKTGLITRKRLAFSRAPASP
jgi:hypothetical protein